ncbi:MAG: hypothetical protein ACQEQ0_07775 [Bacteroidota bacterium]
MALKVLPYDGSSDRREWESFVNDHPDGSVFQMPHMYDAWRQTRNQQVVVLFAYDEGRLAGMVMGALLWNGIFPFSLFSSRLIVTGAPLVADNEKGIMLALLEALIKHTGGKAVFTSILNLRMGLSLKPVFEEAGFYYESRLSVVLDISRKPEEVWKSLTPERQGNIKRLIHADHSVRNLSESEEISGAWHIIRCTRGGKGQPLPHRSLFSGISSLKQMDSHFVFKGLIVDNRLEAVVLVLMHKDRAWFWYQGDCLKASRQWMYDGFLWNVITELQSAGYCYLDMGDGGRPGKDVSFRRFKKSYGGMVKETGRYVYIHNWTLWRTGRVFFRWYKKIRKFVFTYYCKR